MQGNFKYHNPTKLYFGENTAEEGLEALKNWMLEIGLPLTITEIGATPEDIKEILRESL